MCWKYKGQVGTFIHVNVGLPSGSALLEGNNESNTGAAGHTCARINSALPPGGQVAFTSDIQVSMCPSSNRLNFSC